MAKTRLLTQELKARFKEVGRQDTSDPLVLAKFFNPSGAGTWYATAYDEETHLCFGYVTGLGDDEWGCFSIPELESVQCPPFGLHIERDIFFDEVRFSELRG